jgi:putative methionine-R-sulfoxide reductase with GAF domain
MDNAFPVWRAIEYRMEAAMQSSIPRLDASDEEMNSLLDWSNLYRRTWRNWIVLVSVLVLMTIGLATSMPPLIRERLVSPWPWLKTDLVLFAGLSVLVLIFIAYMTQQQGHVLHMHRRLQELQKNTNDRLRIYTSRLYALSSISHMMGSVSNLQGIFDHITEMCGKTFDSSRASLMLYDRETNELIVRSVSEESKHDLLGKRQKVGEGIAGWAAKQKKAILLGDSEDTENYPELNLNNDSIVSAMVVPIVARDELVGVLNVSSRSEEVTYCEEDLLALQVFAENAGACIRHNEQADMLRQMIPSFKESN